MPPESIDVPPLGKVPVLPSVYTHLVTHAELLELSTGDATVKRVLINAWVDSLSKLGYMVGSAPDIHFTPRGWMVEGDVIRFNLYDDARVSAPR